MRKICTKCKVEKDLSDFYKSKVGKDGHNSRCKYCMNLNRKPKSKEAANRDAKNYALRHPEKIKQSWKNYYQNNKEILKEKSKIYKLNNEEKIKETRDKYYSENKELINQRKRERRKNSTPQQKVTKCCRDRFAKIVKRLKKSNTNSSWRDFIGCSTDFLKTYIENQFTEGMTWENHGNGVNKWNIDHIKQLCKFDLFDEEQLKEAFHYTNLRPLWFIDNMKRSKYD